MQPHDNNDQRTSESNTYGRWDVEQGTISYEDRLARTTDSYVGDRAVYLENGATVNLFAVNTVCGKGGLLA